jgi:hypothetical protein
MNVLKNPWYVSPIIFAIWELVIMKIEFLPFIVHHTTQLHLDQIDKNYIDTVRPVAVVFFYMPSGYYKITYHRDSVIKKIDIFSAGIDIKRNIITENLKLRIKSSFFRNIGLLTFIKKTEAD